MAIVLTNEENELFGLLRSFVEETRLGVTMRAAGGWVRDKVMGETSDDIDIALDTCTGSGFAQKLFGWLNGRGLSASSFGVIPRNPEQSKHLETATMRILGFSVDFSNLRTETYSDTRIPIISVGTPSEDASRRDFTVNSLFYNLHESKIEDFTGMGMEDLRVRLLRTPLMPKATLLDDPLRVLRALRFSSRLGFEIHTDLMAACRDPDVLQALEKKVSRERVGIEVDKMLSSGSPHEACRLIANCGSLADTIFALPQDEAICVDEDRGGGSDRLLSSWRDEGLAAALRVESVIRRLPFVEFSSLDTELRKQLYFSAILSPLARFRHLQTKTRSSPLSFFVLAESLKRPRRDSTRVASIQSCECDISEVVGATCALPPPARRQSANGSAMKHRKLQVATETTSDATDIPQCHSRSSNTAGTEIASMTTATQKQLRQGGQRTATSSLAGARRVIIGRILRNAGSDGVWQAAVVLAAARHAAAAVGENGNDLASSLCEREESDGRRSGREKTGDGRAEVQQVVDEPTLLPFSEFVQEVNREGLESVFSVDQYFNGNELVSVLPKLKKGPMVRQVLEAQLDWTLANPNGNKEDCESFLRTEFQFFV